jgi:hypothetical protein
MCRLASAPSSGMDATKESLVPDAVSAFRPDDQEELLQMIRDGSDSAVAEAERGGQELHDPGVDQVHAPDPDSEGSTTEFDGLEEELSSAVEARQQVHTCHCQHSIPPQHHAPACLPVGAILATREIQMFPEFRANLLCTGGAPPKTQTLRIWGRQRTAEHHMSYTHNRWIRVWRGQGHKATIGWLLITHWDTLRVDAITHMDCVREGVPHLSTVAFRRKYFNGLAASTRLLRVQFLFRPCLAIRG